MAAALAFEHVTKEYREGVLRPRMFRALDDFSLEVRRGEIFGFLGPNGAGKTTAIHLALGFMRPTNGGGTMLGHAFGHAPTRRRVGFLAESAAFHSFRARALLRFYGQLNGVRDPELRERSRALLRDVGLEEVGGKSARKFSRGMMQRLGLAQALMNDPELLVLDEPTSALDPVARVEVREILQRAKSQGKTVFLSSHLLSEVELICDRVAILHRGRVVRLGKVSELLEKRDAVEVVSRGADPAKFPGAEAVEGGLRLTVKAAEQRATLQAIWAAGGEVISVNPQRRSLEEIFLELAAEEKR